ncbi:MULTISPECIES: helix-turn-helix domain-containing protein [unclassified Streptomyces]|uniref:helix-turn-helix domain-containing protein n=1 Tax=unclassified Streptomyces TaxID=2593676 RepID=UPI0015E18BF4|nr:MULTISPECIES: helix-turn-helix domain-containing protein [unclassified Streptomyces]
MLPSTTADTARLEPRERFDYWHQMMSSVISPLEFTSDAAPDYRGRIRLTPLDGVDTFPVMMQAFQSHRTPRLIRRADAELYHIAVVGPGSSPMAVTQSTGQYLVTPGTLYLTDTSRPFSVLATQPERYAIGHCVEIPKRRLDLPRDAPVDQLLARPLAATHGFGALIAQFLTHLQQQHHAYQETDAPQLAATLGDLITGLITHTLDTTPPPDSETAERTLLIAVRAFIERHLDDPDLKPAAIAAHHHISTRQLQRLFQRQGTTPAAHIRQRRLERAHRDLSSLAHARTPIHTIARRRGFTSHTVFTRTYTRHYGRTPTHTRDLALNRRRPTP